MPTAASLRKPAGILIGVMFFAGLVAPSCANGQVAGGTISGTISDSTGRVISGAEVLIKNVATGVTRNATTNTDGLYTAPNLLPGTYELTFKAAGFKAEARTGVVLT